MNHTQSSLRGMIEELLEKEEGLSEWEVNFVESMSKWDGDFTPKQADKIVAIYEEKA